MTDLSVNLNKIALLRNSRGREYPSVVGFAERFIRLGADGITIHPRPDQRHARYSDCYALQTLCHASGKELNIEGYPTDDFLKVVLETRPAQCTLVPDDPTQLTSDHGWRLTQSADFLQPIIERLHAHDIRVSLFVDYDSTDLAVAKKIGADRVELYTEPYAETFEATHALEPALTRQILAKFKQQVDAATALGLGVNAGHDLNLQNLKEFLQIGDILEVSIGHALTVECLEYGIEHVMQQYVEITR